MADSIIAFDRYAARYLQTIRDRQTTSASLPQILASFLAPFSAFESRDTTEAELRHIPLEITSEMASRLPTLVEDAEHIDYLFSRISDTLGSIRGLSLNEIKKSPEMAVLAELWVKLTRHDDYAVYKSHQHLLNDIMTYYASVTEVIKDTLPPLNKMRSDLHEFRDIHASPVLAWRDFPLEITLERMGQSIRRLEVARRVIDGLDLREAKSNPLPIPTRYATLVSKGIQA
jgi:hypothetical protein